MNRNANHLLVILLKCIGLSFAILLATNLVAFFLGLIFLGLNEDWEFQLKYGVFFSNGRALGLKLFEPAANGLVAILFIAFLADEFKNPSP